MTAEKIARFCSADDASAFADQQNLQLLPHPSGTDYILIFFRPDGVFAAHENGSTGERLEDW